MRPLRLEFCGINSFSEPAKIDFVRLSEFGLFGIFGDTGSGKSTILDCIGFALYGNVSRARSGSIVEIIHFGSDRANVRFEFEIVFEGKRRTFSVERELKRKNALQSVKVFEKKEGNFVLVCEGVRESNAFLERVVGLEQKDFEKCIALPQGEFAQFVKAPRSDRLKLVSRLFDLEEYGEKLVKKANALCASLAGERNLLSGSLNTFADVSPETIESLKRETEELGEKIQEGGEALSAAKSEENRLNELWKGGEERKKIHARLEVLQSSRERIERMERELSRLERAQTAARAAKESKRREEEFRRASEGFSEAEILYQRAEEREKDASKYDEEGAEEEIARLGEIRAKAEQAEKTRKRRADLLRELQSVRAAYAEEAKQFGDFSYEREWEEIEKSLKELGQEDFWTYVENHGKAALLRAEYAQFAQELGALCGKYPKAEEIASLREKYSRLSEGEKESFSAIRASFEEIEKSRRKEQEKKIALEKRNGLYLAHRDRLQQLQTEGVRKKEELSLLEEEEKFPPLAEIEEEIAAKKRQKKLALSARDEARRELSKREAALAAAREKFSAARENLLHARAAERDALSEGGFSSAEEAEGLIAEFGDSDARAQISAFREEFAALSAKSKELSELPEVSEEECREASERRERLEKEWEERVSLRAVKCADLSRGEKRLAEKKNLEEQFRRIDRKAEVSERLKKLLEGNKFMEFAAEEYLQNVARNGSERLLNLTRGRYFLRYEGGFFVGDNLCGGTLRGVSTLSGGETFLVSLSLALALSAEICMKSLRPIEFFFLDEGFGTLDSRLVDVVMDSLEKLKGENFTIGVISHVEELKHRIERKLSVEKATEDHGSRIEIN